MGEIFGTISCPPLSSSITSVPDPLHQGFSSGAVAPLVRGAVECSDHILNWSANLTMDSVLDSAHP